MKELLMNKLQEELYRLAKQYRPKDQRMSDNLAALAGTASKYSRIPAGRASVMERTPIEALRMILEHITDIEERGNYRLSRNDKGEWCWRGRDVSLEEDENVQ